MPVQVGAQARIGRRVSLNSYSKKRAVSHSVCGTARLRTLELLPGMEHWHRAEKAKPKHAEVRMLLIGLEADWPEVLEPFAKHCQQFPGTVLITR